jgi:hypothetical protein
MVILSMLCFICAGRTLLGFCLLTCTFISLISSGSGRTSNEFQPCSKPCPLCAIFMRFVIIILFLFFRLATFGQRSVLPIRDTCSTFGIACGMVGLPQLSIMQTVYLVNKLDSVKLFTWLNSDNPQNQIHGYIGLYFMKRNGIALTEKQSRLMKKIEQSESRVNCCNGCIIGLKEKMSTLLNKKALTSYYKWYLRKDYEGIKERIK